MRKLFLILGLTMVTVLATSSDAFAQRWRGGRGGYNNNYNNNYRGGYNDNYYRGGSGWGITIGSGGVRYYDGGNYGGNYGTRYYSEPYYSGNQYYYSDPVVQVPATEYRESFYSEPAVPQQVATMIVLLPRPDATVWFDGAPTSQQGMQRTFHSPQLQSGGTYSYTIRARWTENGQTVERERRVNVQPNQSVTVSFRDGGGENLPSPRSK
jgi:uncharacterized protein (TIGR03000 family)